MQLKKNIDEIKKDINKNGLNLSIINVGDGTYDISSAFGEIFIRTQHGLILRLNLQNEDFDKRYTETINFILKNWIIV